MERLKVSWKLVEGQNFIKMHEDIRNSEGFDEWCKKLEEEAIIHQLKLMGWID